MQSGQSKYLETMQKLTADGVLKLHGDRLLVELLETGEKKTKSGIVIGIKPSTPNVDEGQIAVVLAVGEGYYDPDDPTKLIDLPNKAGDIVIVNKFQLKHCGELFDHGDENKVAMVSQSNVHATIKDLNALITVFKG